MLIKWNPAIKTEQDKGLIKALLDDQLTSSPRTMHHILWRKRKTLFSIYVRRPDGSALAQLHVRFYKQELISLEK
jgi:hypothetical protein